MDRGFWPEQMAKPNQRQQPIPPMPARVEQVCAVGILCRLRTRLLSRVDWTDVALEWQGVASLTRTPCTCSIHMNMGNGKKLKYQQTARPTYRPSPEPF